MSLGERIQALTEKVKLEQAAVFLLVAAVSAGVSYTFLQEEPGNENPAVEIHEELNSSRDSMNIDFFNESMEIAMETGSETRFYLYLYGEGNADMQLTNLTRDGRIRSSTQILDYPSGVYLLHYSYNIGPDEEHWLRPEEIEKLG